ncbi:WD repeat-containing protein WRAP73 isoform X2 [Lasioglossum baleicum]|uniref:WD repeat-containing protein WRAP73 isoform X2 n=1 Tax=Lasioglossum baleicum TaxID=434251 RepID=UPI003FCD7AD1
MKLIYTDLHCYSTVIVYHCVCIVYNGDAMTLEVEKNVFRINNQLCEFSPDGRFFAIVYQANLIVKSSKTTESIHSFVFTDIIEYLEWSRNSEYILCANIKKTIVQVYSIHYPEWQYKLVEGSAGLESITWSPDSKHILILSNFNIQISVWSLENRNVNYIQNMKSSFRNLYFSPNGKKLAIVVSNEGDDTIEIYKTDTWKLYKIVLLNHVTWKPLLQLHLDPIIKENYLHKVYEERVIQTKLSNKITSSQSKRVLEEKCERPINIKIGKNDDIDRFSIAKFDIVEFSFCGQYLAIKHELYPTALWIWNIVDDYLDYLLLENKIVAVRWNPTRAQLFAFCECAHMFEWTPQKAICLPTPRNITVLDARCHPRGNLLLLCGYNKAIIYQNENKS